MRKFPARLSFLTNRLGEWFNNYRFPKLDWIQVEVSSYCNASCAYCPHTIYRENWNSRHLPLATFVKLIPVFGRIKMVFLQGWGEPLLNPAFFEMVGRAKKRGCVVGTSTNGTLLDEVNIDKILSSGLDILAVSLAGTDEKNDAIRAGTNINGIVKSIELINKKKTALGTERPSVHLAYLLLRSRIADLDNLADFACGLGIDQVVVSTLDFIPDDASKEESTMACDRREMEAIESKLKNLKNHAGHRGTHIHYQVSDPRRKVSICSENIRRSMFISADGSVSPCVFTNIPVNDVSYIPDDVEYPYRRLCFGDVDSRSPASIWFSPDYISFRNSFLTGDLNKICRNCGKTHIMQAHPDAGR